MPVKKPELHPSKIIGLQFGIMSPEEIRKGSVVEVTTRDTYINNKPVPGGLFDTRMGVIESGLICPTDGHDYMQCPGYFGHIELAKPVYYIQYLTTLLKILKCVCYKCSKLLISKEDKAYIVASDEGYERWNKLFTFASKQRRRCGDDIHDGCGCKQPTKIAKTGLATIVATWEGMPAANGNPALTVEITPEHAIQILSRISDQDVDFLGFNSNWSRPEWMVCQVLVVPPPAVRPSVKQGSSQRSEDDLTHILVDIIKTNTTVRDKLAQNATQKIVAGWTTVLQYYVATMIDNNISGVPQASQRSGRPMKSVKERLNGKAGRIRGNLMGKRVNFSSRSVITPDPNISVRELGVPLKIAMNLTRPIIVNARNREFLLGLVRRGPDEYPGAKILEKQSGENISLRYVDRVSLTINLGDTVHRHMLDGDEVMFNRQPTLHRMSMMCHLARIMHRGDTFRLNVADTKPYNADFDGDEMNMHLPQDDEAATELRHLAAVPYQMISPANNKTIVGIFQDSLLGAYQITRENVAFNHRRAMNMLMLCDSVDVSKFPARGRPFTNFNVMTQIMPPMTLTYKTKKFGDTEDYKTSNNVLEIRNGRYVRGQMEKGVLGDGGRGLLHRICNDFGNLESAKFVDDLQNIVTDYMKTSAFSVGISDLIANTETNQKITEAITIQKEEVAQFIDQVHLGILENNTGKSTTVEFETKVNNSLNRASNLAGKIGKTSLAKGNRFVTMVNAGSKGGEINISQMVACLGQQNVDGKRIPYGYEGRTLPHFTKYDDRPAARGFVESSFIEGLTPTELFFHAMGGREGLIDTAVKTSQTGYISRRLIKSMEDLVVCYDMTVRNHMKKIVQYSYGDDGFDSVRVEGQIFEIPGMSITEIYAYFNMTEGVVNYTVAAAKRATSYEQKESLATKLQEKIQDMIDIREKLVVNVFDGVDNQMIHMPVAFDHIINNVAGQMEIRKSHKVDITPLETMDLVESGLQRLRDLNYVKPTMLFEHMYYYKMTPRNLLERHQYNRRALIALIDTVVHEYMKSIIAPGEMAGIIAAQSIGEPTTQMTLNTFHLAGVASKSNVTRGVPRIEEILTLTENPKNPSCTLTLKYNEQYDRANVRRIIPYIENVKLRKLVKETAICFDPDGLKSLIAEDRLLVAQYSAFETMVGACNGDAPVAAAATDATTTTPPPQRRPNAAPERSKWIMRIVLDELAMVAADITMDDIFFILNTTYGDTIECIFADHNADKLIFRIRTNVLVKGNPQLKGADPLDQSDEIYLLKKFQDNMLDNVILRGIKDISRANPRKIVGSMMYDQNEGKYVPKEQWVIDTVGTNFMDILALDSIDVNRTTTNDIQEVYRTLGIEAARQTIYNELREVIEFDGSRIDSRHMNLLTSRICYSEKPISVFRHGLNGDKTDPVAKMCFEESATMVLRAATHGDTDCMRGVSASILVGAESTSGTNMFDVVLDLEMMTSLTHKVELEKRTTKEQIAEEFGDMDDTTDVACSAEQIGIVNNVASLVGADMGEISDEYDAGF